MQVATSLETVFSYHAVMELYAEFVELSAAATARTELVHKNWNISSIDICTATVIYPIFI